MCNILSLDVTDIGISISTDQENGTQGDLTSLTGR